QGGDLHAPAARAEGPTTRLRDRHRGRDVQGSAAGQGIRVRARRRQAVERLDGRARQRAWLRAQLAASAPRPAGHAGDRLPDRPLHGARRPHSVAPQEGSGELTLPSNRPGLVPPAADVLAPFRRPPGRALMLGHVHPDADVLGTLLALGLALEARGWRVVYGGPHPAPGALSFLPGVERYQVLTALEGAFDVAVLTDCPNPGRTEGLIDQARAAAGVVVNIDHHPDNRRYGHVNWIDT